MELIDGVLACVKGAVVTLLYVGETVSLCNSVSPEIRSVDQAGLKFRSTCLCLQVLVLKVCATMSDSAKKNFFCFHINLLIRFL